MRSILFAIPLAIVLLVSCNDVKKEAQEINKEASQLKSNATEFGPGPDG